jgi:hypothetical protein
LTTPNAWLYPSYIVTGTAPTTRDDDDDDDDGDDNGGGGGDDDGDDDARVCTPNVVVTAASVVKGAVIRPNTLSAVTVVLAAAVATDTRAAGPVCRCRRDGLGGSSVLVALGVLTAATVPRCVLGALTACDGQAKRARAWVSERACQHAWRWRGMIAETRW